MVLQLLKHNEIKDKLKKVYLLFPTIERMAESPRGAFMKDFLASFYWYRLYLYLQSLLPQCIQVFLQFWYYYVRSLSLEFVNSGLIYAHPVYREISTFLVRDQLDCVKCLDYDLIRDNKSLIKFYYGCDDEWIPAEYSNDLTSNVPDVDIVVGDKCVQHNFMLTKETNYKMALILSQWINFERM